MEIDSSYLTCGQIDLTGEDMDPLSIKAPQTLYDTDSCPICYEAFTQTSRGQDDAQPKVDSHLDTVQIDLVRSTKVYGGNCGHVICSCCFESLLAYGKKACCPLCRVGMIVELETFDDLESDAETEGYESEFESDEEEAIWLASFDFSVLFPERYPLGGGRCETCRLDIPRVTYHGCLCTHPPLCNRCYESERDCECIL